MPDQIEQSLDVRVKAAQQRINVILAELHLTMGAVVQFPLYKKLPAEVELALKVIMRHEGEYHVAFQDKVEPEKGGTARATNP
ncbi:MAG: hypothetical protein KGJ07_01515 [Patescibacteria group bacterium]|nr:hypothetical protein [Patescibacteria group bacterium]